MGEGNQMRYYFKEFIKENYKGKSDAYLFIFWSAYKNINSKGRLSNYIKEELQSIKLAGIKEKRKKGEDLILKLKVKGNVSFTKNYPHIESIQIKDFKGFGSHNENDKGSYTKVDRYKNIFFGPNGAGKTSFCEALEYRVTSDIKERKRRSIALKDYITRGGNRPSVNVVFNNDEIDEKKMTDYDKEFFHRCFIEKNRLQEFSLLGSKDTGVKGSDIIANLLGLHELDDLLSSFVKPNSFKLDEFIRYEVGGRRKESEEKHQENLIKREVINEQKLKVFSSIVEKFHLIDDKNILLDIESLLEINKQRAEDLTSQKETMLHKELVDIDSNKVFNEIKAMQKGVNSYLELVKKIGSRAVELNYESFYNALNKVGTDKGYCPACNTPIDKVAVNPFEKANLELDKLKEITNMKRQLDSMESTLDNQFYDFLKQLIKDLKRNMSNFEQLYCSNFFQAIEQLEASFDKQTKNECVKLFIDKNDFHVELQTYFDNQRNISSEFEKDKDILKSVELKIKESEALINDLTNAKKQIGLFNNELKEINSHLISFESHLGVLKEQEEKEVAFNEFISNVEGSYKQFYEDLTKFKLELEKKQISNIEGKILEYYNLINKHDDLSEVVNKISFRLEEDNYRIFINKGTKNQVIDAHALLSEGHLRSLGLSIMLAVAEKNNVPFIVFDDIVNAIDSDHRANIIEMMFTNSFLKRTQQLVTTHDRLFWERYCNSFNKINGKKHTSTISHIFKNTETGTIIKQYNIDFESKILNALDNYDIRQALVYCRIWFESIATSYCVEKNLEMTGRFTHNKTSNHLKASLESIYEILINEFKDNDDLPIIKNDIINWKGQNQEHHSFDEHSYNFVHSKNSDEVSKTFNAIRRFANDLNKKESISRISKELESIKMRLISSNNKVTNEKFKDKAPQAVVDKEIQKNEELQAKKMEYENELERLRILVSV
ncbi:hypothetical protein FQV26_13510 [Planococcus sp. CPCC 101016]|uniref:AAA family ATPase n=1 Tax=Planococcus sp. CPCC 101016 TaxID=2599617 RepID=UPI0011B44341|nr:AAA family ATPase [Planococcus sp. CPCC 101016]TWT05445.1 hypothetical protein FQV26_13510 [Planococcus sp. CPCC 101016]